VDILQADPTALPNIDAVLPQTSDLTTPGLTIPDLGVTVTGVLPPQNPSSALANGVQGPVQTLEPQSSVLPSSIQSITAQDIQGPIASSVLPNIGKVEEVQSPNSSEGTPQVGGVLPNEVSRGDDGSVVPNVLGSSDVGSGSSVLPPVQWKPSGGSSAGKEGAGSRGEFFTQSITVNPCNSYPDCGAPDVANNLPEKKDNDKNKQDGDTGDNAPKNDNPEPISIPNPPTLQTFTPYFKVNFEFIVDIIEDVAKETPVIGVMMMNGLELNLNTSNPSDFNNIPNINSIFKPFPSYTANEVLPPTVLDNLRGHMDSKDLIFSVGLQNQDALEFFSDWWLNRGPEARVLGPDNPITKELRQSPFVVNTLKEIEKFGFSPKAIKNGYAEFFNHFGPSEFAKANINLTLQMIGSYSIYVIPTKYKDFYRVSVLNETNWESGTRSLIFEIPGPKYSELLPLDRNRLEFAFNIGGPKLLGSTMLADVYAKTHDYAIGITQYQSDYPKLKRSGADRGGNAIQVYTWMQKICIPRGCK
jgi:hypothetical protein